MGHQELPCQRQVWTGQGASISGPGLFFFFFFLQVLFYQWFGQKNKLKPRGQHVLYKTCTCPEGETVAVQRPNFWSSLISTSREAPLYYARDHQKGSGSSWTHSFSDRRIILHPRTSWPLLSHLHPYL